MICIWSNEFNEKDKFMKKRFIIRVNIVPEESYNFSSPHWYPEERIAGFVRGIIQMKREKKNMDDVQAQIQLKVIGSRKNEGEKKVKIRNIWIEKRKVYRVLVRVKEYDGEKNICCGF